MRARLALAVMLLGALGAGPSTAPTTRYVDNTDESKAGTFVLPDPLIMQNGQRVADATMWETQRRPQLLELFRTQVYGIAPPPPPKSAESFHESRALIGGEARTQLQVSIDLGACVPGCNGASHPFKIDALIYQPAAMNARAPVLLCFSFSPLHMITPEADIPLMDGWNGAKNEPEPAKESDRGKVARGWPIEKILARGYAIAIIYYQQIEPDVPDPHSQGLRWAFSKPGEPHRDDAWGTIAAWTWGAGRVMDYLQQQPDLDSSRIAIMGHSRLGKTALWTGASDDRFALVIAAQSGRGGAAIARRNFGESIQRLTNRYGYQFCKNYVNWASHVDEMPIDTNELIALVAPRPFYQTASVLDTHSDPKGEFLAEVGAGPVYQLFGKEGLATNVMPPLNEPIMHTLGFHYRPGRHEVSAWDWDRFLDFADLQFRHIAPTTRLAG